MFWLFNYNHKVSPCSNCTQRIWRQHSRCEVPFVLAIVTPVPETETVFDFVQWKVPFCAFREKANFERVQWSTVVHIWQSWNTPCSCIRFNTNSLWLQHMGAGDSKAQFEESPVKLSTLLEDVHYIVVASYTGLVPQKLPTISAEQVFVANWFPIWFRTRTVGRNKERTWARSFLLQNNMGKVTWGSCIASSLYRDLTLDREFPHELTAEERAAIGVTVGHEKIIRSYLESGGDPNAVLDDTFTPEALIEKCFLGDHRSVRSQFFFYWIMICSTYMNTALYYGKRYAKSVGPADGLASLQLLLKHGRTSLLSLFDIELTGMKGAFLTTKLVQDLNRDKDKNAAMKELVNRLASKFPYLVIPTLEEQVLLQIWTQFDWFSSSRQMLPNSDLQWKRFCLKKENSWKKKTGNKIDTLRLNFPQNSKWRMDCLLTVHEEWRSLGFFFFSCPFFG